MLTPTMLMAISLFCRCDAACEKRLIPCVEVAFRPVHTTMAIECFEQEGVHETGICPEGQ